MMRYYVKRCYKTYFLLFLISSSLVIAQNDSLKYPPSSKSNVAALNFKDTDIKDILRSLAYEYKTNIMVDNNIATKISTALYNVELFNVIKMIAEDNGLEFSYDGKRFFVRKIVEKPLPKPIEPEPEIDYSSGKISIKINDIEVNKLVEKLREKTNRNYVVISGTVGKVSGTLAKVNLEKGLNILFQNNGFNFVSKDSIYYISSSGNNVASENNNTKQQKQSYWVSAHEEKISIDVTQANLDRILNDLTTQMGLQIIKLNSPTANVTVRCSDVTIERALEYLFKGTEFSYRKDKDAFIVGNKSSKSLEETKLIKLGYLRADNLKEKLPTNLTQGISVNVSLEHNALIFSGNHENIRTIEEYIKLLDKPVPQVLIEAIVVDYNLDNSLQYGISAGTGDSSTVNRRNKWLPGMDVTVSGSKLNKILNSAGSINLFGKDLDIAKLGKLPDDFYLNLKALEQNGVANVKSKPLLATLNGHTASLKIGTVQNYVFNDVVPFQSTISTNFIEKERIEKIEANISFEITPWVGPNNEMTLEIKPEFQTPIGDFVPDKKLIPAINTRSFFSTVRLKDGETIILGGLIQEKEIESEEKVPLLGDIPLLGKLFTSTTKKKSKGELMIYLTPRISYGDDTGYSSYNYSK